MDAFLFDMTGLDDASWSPEKAVDTLMRAVATCGHSPVEDATLQGWRSIALGAKGLPSASVMVSCARPAWACSINDGELGDPEASLERAQAELVELLQACVSAVPLYLGTAVWPFGPETPATYETAAPFRAQQAGPVMFVSSVYVDRILSGQFEAPRTFRSLPTAAGILLVLDDNLLRDPHDAAPRALLKRLTPAKPARPTKKR